MRRLVYLSGLAIAARLALRKFTPEFEDRVFERLADLTSDNDPLTGARS